MANKQRDLESRVLALETHLKVALIVAGIFGVTAGGLLTFIWTGFRTADDEARRLRAEFATLQSGVQRLRSDVDDKLRPTIDGGKAEIKRFSDAQVAGFVRQTFVAFDQSVGAAEWREARLEGAWIEFGEPYARPSYYKDKIGTVHLRGLVKSGRDRATVFILPDGFRPQAQHEVPVACAEVVPCEAILEANGRVWFETGSPKWVSLDGVHFKAR